MKRKEKINETQKETEMMVIDEKNAGKKKRKEKKEKASGASRKHSITWNKNMKTLRNGSYSVAISAVVIVVVVLLNMIAAQIPTKYTQFDISTGKLYTIGDDTKNALEKLDTDITIYHVVQSGKEDSNIEKLLEQYEANSNHIKVVKKDPVVYPSFVTNYSEEGLSENSLIVECGERNKVIAYNSIYETTIDYSTYQQSVSGFDGEGQITSAISYVTSDSLPVVYYVEGHNEVSIPSGLQDRIEKANIELKALSLLTADVVPEDAAGLLMNSPATDYSKEEAKKVEEYLSKGGRAMILTDYIGKDMPNYKSILAAYGVEITDGVVVETDKNHYVQMPYYLVPNINHADVTSGMTGGSQYVLLSGCQGFSTAEDVRDTVNVSEILTTSDDAYIKSAPEKMTTYEREDGDVDGPFAVAALISETISTTDEDSEDDTSKTGETRIVCFASSSILDESFNNSVADGNYTLYTNSLNWLTDTDEAATVSIASKSMETQYLTVTAASGSFFAIILCIVLPVACLIAGGVICYRRKRR